ncbi:hypothetical protein SAMN05216553_1254 [Lentzea fradiae]|uniref:Helix-turn-helix domain-containing protein n=1 Tax=Lentzea fradiae TaxID=200378 RepID=A0A1G8CWM7_9PSEU|nr:hypothetical protein [Lentzea fradiae]SDH49947.1 hypothetical protein SAMN05216553_1254 [Lentzea fradiae]
MAQLRERDVSLRQAAGASGWSKTAIGNVAKSSTLPKLDLVVDVLTSIGLSAEDVEVWARRHARLSVQPPAAASASTAAPARGRSTALIAAIAVLAAVVASGTTALGFAYLRPAASATSGQSPSGTSSAPRPMAVEIHNKVALGAGDLREDISPVYLSNRTVGSCARKGCKIEDTEMNSGVLVVVTCRSLGDELVNFNLDAPESAKNPNSVRSALWYRVVLPDGRSGFVSEVYVAPRDRGGLGLPDCPGVHAVSTQ